MEIERTQAGLSRDVDLLTEKVTPTKIVGRRVSRARATAGRWKDAVMGSDTLPRGAHDGSRIPGQRHAEALSGAASNAASTLADTASTAVEAIQAQPQAVRRQTRGNPLAAGLIAFGAGWLVSSLTPASDTEQDLAEQARQQAADLARPLAEEAKQAAAEGKNNLAPQAQEAVKSVRSAASDVGQIIAEDGRAAAGHVQGRAEDAAGNVGQNASG